MNSKPTEAERLLEIIRAQNEIAASDLDHEAAMAMIVERAVNLTEAGGAVISTPEDGGLVVRAVSGEVRPELGDSYPIEGSLGGLCLEQGRVLRSDDCVTDSRVVAGNCRRAGARSIIAVPLIHAGETLGVLSAYAAAPSFFGPGEVDSLELVAATISAHLHHAHSFAVAAHRSVTDALTGLYNRRAYEERLPAELARSSRASQPISLCLLDLDGFKAINDRHGHPVGDEVLRAVAAAIKRARISDEVFRIGGDEFAILLPGCTLEDAETAVARLLAAIDVGPIVDLEPDFGISHGIASGPDVDPDEIHATADHRLGDAKRRLYARQFGRGGGRGHLRLAV